MKTIVHVDQRAIKANLKNGTDDPVITVKNYRSNKRAYEIEIRGASRLVYSPKKPLACGARVWLETLAEVEIVR